jgi:raffinose/stachyose/melibiose transport system substrate-binding protein
MKKTLMVLLAICVVASALAAADKKQTVVKYWASVNDSDETDYRAKWNAETIALFEKANPDIKIEFTNTPNGDQYLNKITTEMAAGNVPDVFQGWVAGRLEPFVKAGRIEPLDGWIAKSPALSKVLSKGNMSSTTFNGKIYALPNELAGEFVYINKKIFADSGVKIPATWPEFIAAVKAFAAKGVLPIALGNKDPWPGTIPFMYIFDRLNGTEKYKEAVFNKQATFDTPAYVEAAKLLVQLRDAGAYPDEFNSLEYTEGSSLFQTGKAAMTIDGSWMLPNYIKGLGGDLDIIPFPDIPGKASGKNNWLGLQNEGYSIGSSSKVKEAAFKFLSFLFSVERQTELANSGKLIATTGIPIDPNKVHPVAIKAAKSLSGGNVILIWDVMLGNNIGKELNLATQSILQGGDIKEALTLLNKAAKLEWKK